MTMPTEHPSLPNANGKNRAKRKPMPEQKGHNTSDASLPKDHSTPPAETANEEIVKVQADAIQNIAGAGYVSAVVSSAIGDGYDPNSFIEYRDELLRQCGEPTDPLVIMMIEQIALAFHAIGGLRLKSVLAKSPEVAIAFSDAGTRLLAEFRRCVLALEDYRVRGTVRQSAEKSRGDGKEGSPAPQNGKNSRRMVDKKATGVKQPNNGNGSAHPWPLNRMQFPTPVESLPVGETIGCGEG
jgi:hypothetical protein